MTIRMIAGLLSLSMAVSCMMSEDYNAFYDGEFYPSEAGDEGYDDGGDSFDEIRENPFVKTSENDKSTFSVDADGAAYGYMRKMVNKGSLPQPNSVRIEEYLNYFTFDYPEPQADAAVAINGEVGECPWNKAHKLMRLGIKGRSIPVSRFPKANYVFLIDVSGSMNTSDKLDLLKSGLAMLVDNLNPQDRISIVTYSGTVKLLLESTLVSQSSTIKKAISSLAASGSTAGGAAMKMAYEECLKNYIEGGNNRVIMGTDGDFNVGVTSTDAILEMAQDYAAKGIYLTVCGFGTGNLNDSMMEKVSNAGNGTYQYIDSEDELTKVFVNEVSKFFSVANDAKVQITFAREKVDSYRLIGYENRVLSSEDFENDDKDAGEIGAGQTVTALYEIIPAEGYGEGSDIAVFDFRYKDKLGEDSIPLSCNVGEAASTSTEFRFAAGVAAYGLTLLDSQYRGDADFAMAYNLAGQSEYDPHGYRAAFCQLVLKASEIK